MPWNEEFYPPAMRNLPGPVREKAVEIANALLDQGYDEGKAIRIGLAKAREWADKHWEEEIEWDDIGIDWDDER
jgi:uncharacterized protein YdaT